MTSRKLEEQEVLAMDFPFLSALLLLSALKIPITVEIN